MGNLILCWRDMPRGIPKYHAYLASREWAQKKLAIKRRSGGDCEYCRIEYQRTRKATQVHHQTYANLYHEPIDDLLHVCEECRPALSGRTEFEYCVEHEAPAPRCCRCGTVGIDPVGFNNPDETFCEVCVNGLEDVRRAVAV